MRHVKQLLIEDGRRDVVREMATGESGQSLIVIALFFSLFMAVVGIAIDIAWFQFNVDRIQRASDAGALAGVVYLPGNLAGAQTAAIASIKRNGYVDGVNGASVAVVREPGNDKMLRATVSAPVRTFFARMFGIANFSGSRYARAEFILPVPMGSPQNYYGINVVCRNGDTPGGSPACPPVPDAVTASPLTPLGFFGGVEYWGGDRQNGDAYSTYYNSLSGPGGLNVATSTNGNTAYDANGYSYIADFPAGTVNGSVWLYDPTFCATGGQSSSGRRLGVGDYWFASGGTPMTTAYKIWDMNGTPYDFTDDIPYPGGLKTYVSNGVDQSTGSNGFAGNGDYGGGATSGPDCQLDLAHNRWVLWATGLAEGQYRLQVVTNGGNPNQNGINGFGIEVTSTSGPLPHVYGQSRMEAFIVINNTSVFYLAQVEAVHAGKFLEIKLFDPGDITSTTFKLRIPSASAPGYTYATFTYTATGSSCGAATSGGPTTSLVTSSSSCKYYNNQWVTILAQIPTGYTAPVATTDPPGSGGGWWKIEYGTLGTGQDITTWQVNIRGNPVHLVVP